MVTINKKKSFVILLLIAIVIFLVVFSSKNHSVKNISQVKQKQNFKYIEVADKKIKVDIADTPELQERGLSYRKNLKEDEGMLFVFNNSGRYSFWMKDMYFPIDMIWLDDNLKVVYIKKNAKPESYPETFGPNVSTKYVLEVVAGFSEKNNLKEGDVIRFLSS
jgi:hypothetical protein